MKRLIRVPALTASLAAVLTAGLAVPAYGAAGAVRAAPGVRAPVVTLINGDRFAVTPGLAGLGVGETGYRLPGSPADGLISLRLGGAAYEVPYDALPYLGRGLDPALFKVSALLGGEKAGRLTVRVGYHGRVPVLPGVTVTSAGHGSARGYLTAASARVFGAALARQYAADHADAGYGRDGMFGGGVSISLTGSPARAARAALRPRRAPAASLDTLTVHGTDLAGRPDNGDGVWVFNVDNSTLFGTQPGAFQPFRHGTATFGVPTGHYFLFGIFTDISARRVTAFRIPLLPQVTVSGDTAAAIDERAAISRVTMVTPRPATVGDTTLDVHRVPVSGPAFILAQDAPGSIPLWVSPTGVPVTVGKLDSVTQQFLASPKGTSPPYWYGLSYENLRGVIPPQHFVVRPGGLAAVHRRFFSAAPLRTVLQWNNAYPIQFGDFLVTEPMMQVMNTPAPGTQTMYLTASPSLVWFDELTRAVHVTKPFPGTGFFTVQDGFGPYRPGGQTEDWNAYPLHPAPDTQLPSTVAAGPVVASADRAGNVLNLSVTPFSDSTPGHLGAGFGLSNPVTGPEPGVRYAGTFEIDQNGVRVAGGTTKSPGWQATLSAVPSVIRFTLDASRAGKVYPLSTRSHTVWTWRSAPAPGARLPAGWTCDFSTTVSRACAAQPLLSLDYHVAGLGLTGQAKAGKQVLAVSVSHFEPTAGTARVARVGVLVSLDAGATWRPATVTGSGGAWTAVFTAPAGATVSLRTSATDAAGSSVTETLTGAYQTMR
jgi:hypothetical protein